MAINGLTKIIIKTQAKLIKTAIEEKLKIQIKHSDALEILAKSYGLKDWNVLSAELNKLEKKL